MNILLELFNHLFFYQGMPGLPGEKGESGQTGLTVRSSPVSSRHISPNLPNKHTDGASSTLCAWFKGTPGQLGPTGPQGPPGGQVGLTKVIIRPYLSKD